MKERIEAIDIAKGIAIIGILAGHMRFTKVFGIDFVHNIVYQFHVPIFFLISGYFLKPEMQLQPFLARGLKRLMGPYLFTCVAIGIAIYTLALCGISPLERYQDGAFSHILTL